MNQVTRRGFLAVAGGASALLAAGEEPEFPNWSPRYIDRMLTDSPWAKESAVSYRLDGENSRYASGFAQIGMPGGGGIGIPGSQIPGWPRGTGNRVPSQSPIPSGSGSGAKAEMYLITRWASALPIRRAMALEEFGASGLKEGKAAELLARRDEDYVVEIGGFPTQAIRQGAEQLAKDLLHSARLIVPNRGQARAVAAVVPPHGMHLVATLQFPRFEELSPKEGTIEVFAESGKIQLRVRFKLKEMVYDGRLEL
jgi:hypothetical protein